MEAKDYETAWKLLKSSLEKTASLLPDKAPQKIAVLSILFNMEMLEPKE